MTMVKSLEVEEGEPISFAQVYCLDLTEVKRTGRNGLLDSLDYGKLSEQQKEELKSIMIELHECFMKCNPHAKRCKTLGDIAKAGITRVEENFGFDFDASKRPREEHERHYSAPADINSIGLIIHDGGEGGGVRTAESVIQYTFPVNEEGVVSTWKRVSTLNPMHDSLRFPFLFPKGEDSWHPGMKRYEPKKKKYAAKKRLTPSMFARYVLFNRSPAIQLPTFNNAGKLKQECLIRWWINAEDQKLKFMAPKDAIKRNTIKSF